MQTINNLECFIAHAGWEIEGFTYTNSLEALQYSYSKGARLFELDLLETSDNKIVAAHDWKEYKTITNYPRNTDDAPLSETEFLSQHIYWKFTPLNMKRINTRFAQHKDATLVTDKINDPEKLVEEFGYKDRVIMELFSREAVETALKVWIIPMPSDELVFGTPHIEKKLANLNIKYLAISRRNIETHQALLKRVKEDGIKTYAFHINYDQGKDEQCVWEYERAYIYGMYADKLDILSRLTGE